MINPYYRYPRYELWNDEEWEGRLESPLLPLIIWLGRNTKAEKSVYDAPMEGYAVEDLPKHPSYIKKTHSVAPPALVEHWAAQGMSFCCFSIGGVRWVMFYPTRCLDDKQKKLKTIYTFDRADYSDPYWMAKTLRQYDELCRAAAEEGETMLMFLLQREAEAGGFVVELFQEASTRFPIDNDRMFLNSTLLRDKQVSLADIPDYVYCHRSGEPVADPDGCLQRLLGIPVLDISGRWEKKYSLNRRQILEEAFSSSDYDACRAMHSGMGERMMQGIALERDFDSYRDEALRQHYRDMGALYEVRETRGERWITVAPRAIMESREKLPLLIIMQEVGSGNEHLPLTAHSYLYECNRLAAQGEFIALWFVLEDPVDNDLVLEIVEEVKAMYPVDAGRIYCTGHSHNGMFTKEFARRHPKYLAGMITLGNHPGLMGITGTAVGTDDTPEKVEAFHHEDMPTINLAGTCEHNYYFPVGGELTNMREDNRVGLRTTAEERIETWQRRLYAHNCPVKSAEEIIAAMSSCEYAERKLGIPADKSYTLYLDNQEHYVCEIKNNEGKFHLCMVGIDNVPHLPTASMIDLGWSWIRRFARDVETGAVIERY